MTNKWDDYDWDELPKKIQDAFAALGYTEKLWDADKEPASADKDWEELTPAEQAAATVLGYTAQKWDDED